MANVETELAKEIARIVACQYPPSLVKLADTLARADPLVVQTCMQNCLPSAVTKLASIVSAALPLWAYTLDILRKLSNSPDFRHTLLLHTPALLCALLTKANASQTDFDQYADLGVLLLSHPLPDSVPLPASAQPFFLRVFDRAIQAPDHITIRPIYCMLNGACRHLLGLLPSEPRHDFDKKLCHVLSSNFAAQNSMLLLWCFGIAILAEHPQHVGNTHNSSYSSQPPVPNDVSERQWTTAAGRKLFGSPNGVYKTINLTYLSVIFLTSKGDVSDCEAIEGIRIAISILTCVDPGMRQSWPNSTSHVAKNIFPKLPDKILRRGLVDVRIQFEALSFFAMFVREASLPPSVVDEYESVLAQIPKLYTDVESLRETLSVSLPSFAPQLRESTLHRLLLDILQVCNEPVSSQLCSYSVLVQELGTVIPDCTPLRSKMLSALSSNGLQASIRGFLASPGNCLQDVGVQYGDTASALRHRTLVSSTISMLLTAALTAQSTEPGLTHSLAISLLRKQQKLTHIPPSYPVATTPSAHASISLFEQESTQFTGRHLQDWRSRLSSELESQSFYQRDSVIRSVAQICQDLETRCETVEEPLRIEQTKSKELETQVSKLREQIVSLENEAIDRRLYCDGLEAEVGSAENERNSIAARLDDLQKRFADANKEADESLLAAQESFNFRQLQFRSTILTHEEDIEALTKEKDRLEEEGRQKESERKTLCELHDDEMQAMNQEKNRLLDEIQRIGHENTTMNEHQERLKVDLNSIKEELEVERRTTSQQADEISRLESKGADLEHRLHDTEAELGAINGQLSELQLRHQQLVQTSEEALQALEARHEKEFEVATSKANDECKHLEDELQDALHDGKQVRRAYEDSQRELQLLQTTVNALEEEVRQLSDACSEKEEELRALKNRVLASISLVTEPMPARNNMADKPRTPRENRRRKSAMRTFQDVAPMTTSYTQEITNTVMEHVADAHFTSSDSSRDGSTPKRAKRRSTFKTSTVHATNAQSMVYPSRLHAKKSSPTEHSVLRQVSPNRRHTTVGFAIPEKDEQEEQNEGNGGVVLGKRRGSFGGGGGSGGSGGRSGGDMQASFDMDGFLAAGTPFTPGNFTSGTGSGPEEEEEEESATELLL
ncbi:hypothetical protein K504DRAFT_391230 [Pleomassaria siparia CBS 279.74]|uniref:Uncharacterized protein n=1 Tax=Pleomassaria siparia CBS 279.74 TaxID=1314801 RepID=A0A6G1JTM0_9PLEO|nr:hypothetical protein K504DRAFT_391230 [Pleomassaria siparia CBS 279.74]